MAAATPSRAGQINDTGSTTALFLKVWSGEVLAAFAEANIMMDKHVVRSIKSGISAQFPATWKSEAELHTAGAEILGNLINHNEQIITIDGLMIAHAFIPVIDEAMNHYDYRSIYSTQAGRALSVQADKNLMQEVALTARSSALHVPVSGTPVGPSSGGTILTNASYATDGSALATGIFDSAQAMDENDVPDDERYFICRPAQYNLMVQTTDILNRDWGGKGSYSEGKAPRVSGVDIFKSNHVPNSVVANTPNTYDGTFTNTQAICFHKSAVGTVKLIDMKSEMEYDIRRQGTLVLSKYAMGHGTLRPESAVELRSAAN